MTPKRLAAGAKSKSVPRAGQGHRGRPRRGQAGVPWPTRRMGQGPDCWWHPATHHGSHSDCRSDVGERC